MFSFRAPYDLWKQLQASGQDSREGEREWPPTPAGDRWEVLEAVVEEGEEPRREEEEEMEWRGRRRRRRNPSWWKEERGVVQRARVTVLVEVVRVGHGDRCCCWLSTRTWTSVRGRQTHARALLGLWYFLCFSKGEQSRSRSSANRPTTLFQNGKLNW